MLTAASQDALVALHHGAACPAVVRVVVLDPLVLKLALTHVVIRASSQGQGELGSGDLFVPVQFG